VTYSDRFIPTRAASSRLNFSVLDREAAAAEPQRLEREDSSTAYNMLLRSELLGSSPPVGQTERVATPMQSPFQRYVAKTH
jgi:cell division cycle 20-like protein 1 (cofactor of APC complex)